MKRLNKLKTSKWLLKLIWAVERWKYFGRAIHTGADGNRRIFEALAGGRPQAIGKLGSAETLALRKHRLTEGRPDATARSASSRRPLYTNAGVYPDDYTVYVRFCRYMMEEVLPEVTLMSVWFNLGEPGIVNRYCRNAMLLDFSSQNPYMFAEPWSRALAGKRVLAVHPFVDTIRRQHVVLSKVWAGTQVAPAFELDCVRVPHHPTMVAPGHRDWFETLDDLKCQMAARTFDVAIIGAGAYSLPLAVHAKKLGRQGIHLGGGTQLLWGIKGRRWDNQAKFQRFFNDHWTRPLPSDTPPNHESVEGGCYW